MKYFKTYESFKGSGFLKDPAEIEAWLDEMKIENYTIGKDGIVDIKNDTNIGGKNLEKIPVQFGKIDNDFWCDYNQLTNLKGSPKEVYESFWCSHNKLISLRGAPELVGKDFECSFNQLTNLKGAPKEITGDFSCENNQLTSLEGAPEEVGGDFWCYENQLINLVGMPRVRGSFHLRNNRGTPTEILKTVYRIMKTNRTDWDTEIKKYIQDDPTVIKHLPKEELKRLGLDKENRLKSSGLI